MCPSQPPSWPIRPTYAAALGLSLTLLNTCYGQVKEHTNTSTIQVSLQQRDGSHFFEIVGLDVQTTKQASESIKFAIVLPDAAAPPPLLGSYELSKQRVRFIPRFPLTHEVAYRAILAPSIADKSPSQDLVFNLPQPPARPPTVVSRVYPTSEHLPAYLLKFYIHFSSPMSRGRAYEHIRLQCDGEEVDHPFLELGEELWDGNQQRFTLFIHPGLIKRGLAPRQRKGPAISEGHTYTLHVDANWPDARGRPLGKSFTKNFTVAAEDHIQPDLTRWKIDTPPPGSQDPVCLRLNEPLDHAMLSRVLSVRDQFDTSITGRISVLENETLWTFKPTRPWKVGTYFIDVAANLEDLCGNSIARPFEVKMQEQVAANPATQVAIEFIVQ